MDWNQVKLYSWNGSGYDLEQSISLNVNASNLSFDESFSGFNTQYLKIEMYGPLPSDIYNDANFRTMKIYGY